MGTLRTIGSISRDRHISCGLTGRRFTQHRQKPARGEGVRVGPWPNSDSFPLQLAILPGYSDGLVLKSKFLSVSVNSYQLTLRNDSAGGALVNLTGVAFQYDALTRTATWDFAGVSGIMPAYYTAILNSAAISNGGGLSLDGDGDGTGGDDFTSLQLVARRGDVDLDGDVDIGDFNSLATSFDPLGNNPGNGWPQGNFDGDADIDIVDFGALVRNFDPGGYAINSLTVALVRGTEQFFAGYSGDYAKYSNVDTIQSRQVGGSSVEPIRMRPTTDAGVFLDAEFDGMHARRRRAVPMGLDS